MPVRMKPRGGESCLTAPSGSDCFLSDRLKASIKSAKFEIVPIGSLKPNPRNTKKHPEKQLTLLGANMNQFGFTTPVVIDEEGIVLCGNARLEAANRLGLDDVPTIRLPNLTKQEKSALSIADNKLAELGEYNLELLNEELAILLDPEVDLGFDPALMGFDTTEVDQLLAEQKSETAADQADQFEQAGDLEPAVSQLGDVWECGPHKLICGNALDKASYDALMGRDRAQMVFADPPYNVPNKGHVTRRAGVREFEHAHGEMSPAAFKSFLRDTSVLTQRFVGDGAVVFVCMDWRHLPELTEAAAPVFGPPRNLIVWVKNNGGLGSFYRSQHECILPFVNGDAPAINNFGLGAKGRFRTNVWRYPGFNSFGRDRDAALRMHPTMKPVALVQDALLDCSHRRGIVLDPFGGSGTTMIAAERSGRCARLIEIDPLYCDVIVRRWQEFTSQTATLESTGQTFEEVANSRHSGEN